MGFRGDMEKRDFLHQSSGERGELDALVGGGRKTQLPLLPYEVQLIHLLGITEEEYRIFSTQVAARGRRRPAEYDHIPDIVNDPVSVVVSLVIGIALTAVSTMLAPKPKPPGEQKGISRQDRGGLTGPERFNSTYGFDSVADLAQYGTPIPIPFGYYILRDGVATGGLVVTPKLVWSRMLSYGSSQALKCQYVVGETDMGYPQLPGVWVGNNTLDSVYANQFALYWNTTPGPGMITAANLVAGERGTPSAADTWGGDQVFVAPTVEGGMYDPSGFSMAYTPGNQTQFGLSNPIANGTDRRLNYKVISIPDAAEGESKDNLKEQRRKWTGGSFSQYGVGVGYSRRMGLISVDGQESDTRTQINAVVGSIGIFILSPESIPEDYFDSGVTSEDIKNESVQDRIRADEILQIGEIFLIGKSTWQVTARTEGVWLEGREIQVNLKCLEVFGDGTVGIIPRRWLYQAELNDGEGRNMNNTNHAQTNFYSLLRIDIATVRNQRPADTTEIGIKSRVYGKMNGLTNFKEVPTPDELEDFDDDDVQLSVGGMNLYFARYSYFTVQIRPAGNNEEGTEYAWEGVQEEFCVRGAAPVDQYNFIRFQMPTMQQWEFRLVPLSCAYITRKPTDAVALLLDASQQNTQQYPYQTPYGQVNVFAAGEFVNMHSTEPSQLMSSKGREPGTGGSITEPRPNAITLASYSTGAAGRAHGYRYALPFDNPGAYPNGYVKTIARTLQGPLVAPGSTERLTVRVFMTSTVSDNGVANAWGQTAVWTPPVIEVNQSHPDTTAGWTSGMQATLTVDINGSNPYRTTLGTGPLTATYNVNVATVTIIVLPDDGVEKRIFEYDTGIAEVSHYGDLITRSCDTGPEHQVAYVNESVDTTDGETTEYRDLTMMGLVLRAGRYFTSMDQPRAWVPRGIKVEKLIDPPNLEPTGEAAVYESSNGFADLVFWMLTNERAGMGDYVDREMVNREEMAETAKFLEQNRLVFDGVLEEKRNVRELITELCPYFLCNFTISGGRFSLTPAVPVDSNGDYANVAVPITAMFSEGNIIEGTFEVSYLELDERRDFQASMQYRRGTPQNLPQNKTVVVRYAGTGNEAIMENYDLTSFCTRRGHAATVARYLLSIRKHVDHMIKFQTSPDGLSLAPGDYIKVITQANPYNPTRNGVVLDDLTIVSALELPDGVYPISYYVQSTREVTEGELTVENGKALNSDLAGIVFTTRSDDIKEHVYLVEQLTLNEEMLVEISASYFPVDDNGVSLITQDLINTDRFVYLPVNS